MPAIAWADARAEIVTLLTGLAIAVPTVTTIKRVHETIPDQIADFPCVLIIGVAKAAPTRSAMLRDREYTVRLRLLVRDADLNRAADILDALQEVITTAFDNGLTLNGKATNVNGPQWFEWGQLEGGGQDQWGSDALVTIMFTDDPGFAG